MRAEFNLNRPLRQAIAGAVILLLGCLWSGTAGDPPAAIVSQFVVQLENYPPPNEAQAKFLLEGAKAEPLPGGQILVTEGTLKNFGTNGALVSLVETPQYTIDTAQQIVTSSGPLRISLANGNFSLEGHGFLLGTNSVLFISNRVHTVIRYRPGHQFLKR